MSAIFYLLHKNKKRNNILFVQFVHQYCFLNLLFNYLEPSLNAINAEFFSFIIKKCFFRTTFITIITNNLVIRASYSQTRQSALYAPIFNLFHYCNSLLSFCPSCIMVTIKTISAIVFIMQTGFTNINVLLIFFYIK